MKDGHWFKASSSYSDDDKKNRFSLHFVKKKKIKEEIVYDSNLVEEPAKDSHSD